MTQELDDIFTGKALPRVKIDNPSKEEMEKQLKEIIKEQKIITDRIHKRIPDLLTPLLRPELL